MSRDFNKWLFDSLSHLVPSKGMLPLFLAEGYLNDNANMNDVKIHICFKRHNNVCTIVHS